MNRMQATTLGTMTTQQEKGEQENTSDSTEETEPVEGRARREPND